MPSVRYVRSKELWVVLGEERYGGPSGELVLKREELSNISAAELRSALSSQASHYGEKRGEATVAAMSEAYFDEDGPADPVEFEWRDQALTLIASFIASWPEVESESKVISAVEGLLGPFLENRGVGLGALEIDDSMSYGPDLAISIQITSSWRGRSVQELFNLGQDILRLCETFADRTVLRDTVADLVRGGGAELLIGQPEGNWLDVKAQEYDLQTLHGEVSLAQAVAKFCNAEEGGLVVIGADAKKVPGGEVIRRVRGVNPHPATVARYQRVLDRRLYPPPLGMRVDVIPIEADRALIVLDIPPQSEELKPFLVHGAIRDDGHVEGAFISIVQRRGEASIPITASMIHATLAAGRALLRGKGSD